MDGRGKEDEFKKVDCSRCRARILRDRSSALVAECLSTNRLPPKTDETREKANRLMTTSMENEDIFEKVFDKIDEFRLS